MPARWPAGTRAAPSSSLATTGSAAASRATRPSSTTLDIDALYIPLPNALHAEWTIRALEAGKPTLCEKPLCGVLPDTERVLDATRRTGTLLWEAFAFPFHAQIEELKALVAGGAIGELMEIKSNFHFTVGNPANIRLSRDLQGGALNDVGCYPIRLAEELFGPEHESVWARATWGGEDVDVDTWAVVNYPAGRRLVLSCGFGRSYDGFTTLEGTAGQIHVTNPFHPGPSDSYRVLPAREEPRSFPAAGDVKSFTPLTGHINAVLRGEEEPRGLAVDTALPTARTLQELADLLDRSRRSGGSVPVWDTAGSGVPPAPWDASVTPAACARRDQAGSM